jgi:predicted Co/Zn/Cd cation transporter (cation efflux family)
MSRTPVSRQHSGGPVSLRLSLLVTVLVAASGIGCGLSRRSMAIIFDGCSPGSMRR